MDAKANYLALKAQLEREAIASLPRSPMDWLTSKQREKVKETQALLAQGSSPFDGMANKGQLGGSVKVPKASQETELSPTKLAALDKKWSERPPIPKETILDDVDLGVSPKPTPGQLICSFCGDLVQECQATRGKGPLRMLVRVEETITPDGELFVDEKVSFQSRKAVSCPNCVLKLDKVSYPQGD